MDRKLMSSYFKAYSEKPTKLRPLANYKITTLWQNYRSGDSFLIMDKRYAKTSENKHIKTKSILSLATKNGINLNTLVLFNYVDKHGKPLFNLIRDKADENRKVFFVSGGTDVSDREAIRGIVEKQNDAIVVASLGTFSTGINIKELHNIIFASPSKSQIRVLQSIGRGLRKSSDGRKTWLYDISDDLSWKSRKNFSLLHSWERLKIYQKEEFEYNTVEVSI